MAKPTKLKNGKYRMQIQVDGQRISKTFDTVRECRIWEATMHDAPATVRAEMTLSDLLERYVKEVTPTKRNLRWESIRIAAFQKRPIARYRLEDLSRDVFADYVKSRLSQNIKVATVKRELSIFKDAIKYARIWKILPEGFYPTKDLILPKPERPRDRLFSQDDIERLEFVAGYSEEGEITTRSQQAILAMHIAFETAMRLGEIMSIRQASFVDGGKSVLLAMTKNGEPRKVPLSKRARMLFQRLELGHFDWDMEACSALFRKLVKKADLQDLRFHDTRHEGITRLAQKIPNVLDLARITGHKDIKMLMVYYNKDVSDLADSL